MKSKEIIEELHTIIDNIANKLTTVTYLEIQHSLDEVKEDLQKLEDHENLEQELGCPLDIIYKAIKQEKIWWHEQWCKIFIVSIYEDHTRPYIEVICKDYKYHRLVFIDNYKKNWWLKEDKSE